MAEHRSRGLPNKCLCTRINFIVQRLLLTYLMWTHKDDYIYRSQRSMP